MCVCVYDELITFPAVLELFLLDQEYIVSIMYFVSVFVIFIQ